MTRRSSSLDPDAGPAPLTPAACNLQDFPFIAMDVQRVLKSDSWVLGTGEEKSAAMSLWLESWHQVPAGSLPQNERMLGHLAQCRNWGKVKTHAMRGWVLCNDGRYYHPVVAEKALEAWIQKLVAGVSGASGNAKRWGVPTDVSPMIAQLNTAILMLSALAPQSKTLKKKVVVAAMNAIERRSHPESQAESDSDAPPDRKGEGEGEGEGEGTTSVPNGTGGADASPDRTLNTMPANDQRKSLAWKAAKSLLNAHGMPIDQTGAFLGRLHSEYGTVIFLDAVEAAIVQRPAEPEAWLKAACMRASGQRKSENKQEQLEASNDAVVLRMLDKETANAAQQ